jgi:hypothetical protein
MADSCNLLQKLKDNSLSETVNSRGRQEIFHKNLSIYTILITKEGRRVYVSGRDWPGWGENDWTKSLCSGGKKSWRDWSGRVLDGSWKLREEKLAKLKSWRDWPGRVLDGSWKWREETLAKLKSWRDWFWMGPGSGEKKRWRNSKVGETGSGWVLEVERRNVGETQKLARLAWTGHGRVLEVERRKVGEIQKLARLASTGSGRVLEVERRTLARLKSWRDWPGRVLEGSWKLQNCF